MNKDTKWMVVSGIAGFSFFLFANFTNLFKGSSLIAACLQINVNAFVFIVWIKVFSQSRGIKKFISFFGVITPVIMAAISIVRVIVPILF